MNTMKKFFLLLVLVISMSTQAQVTKVYLQASGLTCSMCSNAINKALKTLDFVDKVDANISNYTFEISFKEGSLVNFDKIRRKVEDAGFSVSSFIASIYFDNVPVTTNKAVVMGHYSLIFVNDVKQSPKGLTKVRLLDKGFVTSKEYKSNAFGESSSSSGTYHVSL